MPPGIGYPKPATPAPAAAPSFDDALEGAPAEVQPTETDALDAEQAALAEEMGLNPQQGLALRRFLETML